MKQSALLIIAVSLLAGCRSVRMEYTATPRTIKSKAEAKAIIYKAFAEQPLKVGVQQLTVEDDRIEFRTERRNYLTAGGLGGGSAIYYTTVNNMLLSFNRRRNAYIVALRHDKRALYSVVCLTESGAKAFMDAFAYMRETATKPPE